MRSVALVALLAAACSGPAGPADGPPAPGLERPAESGPPAGDRSPREAGPDSGLLDGPGGDAKKPVGLPFVYTRPPAGTPVSPAELGAVTAKYIDLLEKTSYFQFVDDRVHGWPQSDPKKGYWYGTWWSGVGLEKTDGKVSFVHVNVGADNNGISTSPVLEGMCYANLMWPSAKLEQLTRRLIRGFNSWILAMERMPNDPAGTLLARVSYPPPITSTDNGRTIFIDYSADRPGLDSYCQYVHIPANPYWGDIWIKNKRSKDDIGHMLRAIATLADCAPSFSAATAADLQAMRASYVKWAKKVEADGWAIATYDKDAKPYIPPIDSTMSHFITLGNAECNAVLSLKLFSQGVPGTFDCGNGIHPLEFLVLKQEHNGEIIRSFHEAAARHALLAQQNVMAQALLPGLAKRIEDGLAMAESGSLPPWLTTEELSDLIVHSANTGVPLTWREVRWLHKQILEAHAAYVDKTPASYYRPFDPTTPDGAYSYAPGNSGVRFNALAVLLGTCVSSYRNPSSNPVLDCAQLKSWKP